MFWLFISIGVIVLLLIIYIFHPSLKVLFKKIVKKPSAKKKDKEKVIPISKKANVEIVQNREDLFNEEKSFEDKDLRIDYDNLDIGDFFEEEENSNITNIRISDTEKNIYADKLDQDFESIFLNLKKESKKDIDFKKNIYNDDLNDLMDVEYTREKDIQTQFDEMSDEVKALLLSDFLKRKDD